MKQYYILAIVACSYSISSAQNTFPTNGNVGIGISSPEQPLHVHINSDSKPEGIVAPSQAGFKLSRIGTFNYSYSEAAEFRIGHGGPSVWGSKLDLYINGPTNQSNIPDQHAMTWLYNGNVGIGKPNPSHKLDVLGQINVSGQSGGYTTGDIPRLSFGSVDTEFTELVLPFGGPLEYKTFHGHVFKTYGGNNLAVERMRIDIEGNVGIGTADSKGYRLAVNGNVRAREIKVENGNWPDYVFARDYQLPSLQETEKHIKDKGHLPGIPSAAEVKANGVDLGEMNAKLLQKIEELTLHLIEKDKLVGDLLKRVEKLEDRK